MEIDKQKILRFLLIIIALDYTIIGIYSALVPGSFGDTSLVYSQISITVALFTLVVSSDIKKYQNFLWIVVVQEIGEVSVHLYLSNIDLQYSGLYVSIAIVHIFYLLALLILMGRSVIPNFSRSTKN
jgi:hypothetical protein